MQSARKFGTMDNWGWGRGEMDRASLHPSWSFWVQLLKQHPPHPPKPCLAQPSPQDSLLRLEGGWGWG